MIFSNSPKIIQSPIFQQQYFTSLQINSHKSQITMIQNQLNKLIQKISKQIQIGKFPLKTNVKKNASLDNIKKIKSLQKQIENRLEYLNNMQKKYIKQECKNKQTDRICDQQHDRWMRQIIKKRSDIQQQHRKRIKEQQERQMNKEICEQKRRMKQRLQKEQKKRVQLQQSINKMARYRQRRNKQMNEQNEVLKIVMKRQKLYEKLQQNYRKIQENSLQQKKQKLSQIRAHYKPITKQQLHQHLKKINLLKNKHEAQLPAKQINNTNHVYKSKYYQQLLKSSKLTQIQYIQPKINKIKSYSRHVKSNYKPQIDPQKVSQIQNRILSFSTEVIHHNQSKINGLQYLKFSKQLVHLSNQKKTNTSSQNMINQRPIKINYLTQLKKIRENNKLDIEQSVQKIIKNRRLDREQKRKRILSISSILEQRGRRKQELKRSGQMINEQEVDNNYLKAIKAKLVLLND